ncbi:MAG: anti-sigma factor [Chitinophagaceae bacterium]
MTNLQEYINSGIVESYVLGLTDEDENAEFEQLSRLHPEIVAARIAFEEKIEDLNRKNAVQAPPIVSMPKYLTLISSRGSGNLAPAKFSTMVNNGNVTPVRSTGNGGRILAIAAILLLAACLVFMYTQMSSLKTTNEKLTADKNTTDSLLAKILAEQKTINDSSVVVVNMVGTEQSPRSSASVYWDSTSSEVFLVVKNMPKLPSDKQYQLWALIDNQPKDLGVFDSTDDKVILKMKNVQKAQAFAITIEKKGGSVAPTLEKMQSLGKTKVQ